MSPLFADVSVVNKVSNIVTVVIATGDIIYNDDVNGVASVLGFRSYSCSIDLYITFTLLTFFPPQLTRVCDVHVDFFLWKVGIFVLFSMSLLPLALFQNERSKKYVNAEDVFLTCPPPGGDGSIPKPHSLH